MPRCRSLAAGIVAALGSAAPAQAAPAADRVSALPGWDGPLPSAHYSGFVPVDGGAKRLHYYLQEADTAPADKPLVLCARPPPPSLPPSPTYPRAHRQPFLPAPRRHPPSTDPVPCAGG